MPIKLSGIPGVRGPPVTKHVMAEKVQEHEPARNWILAAATQRKKEIATFNYVVSWYEKLNVALYATDITLAS